MNSFLKILLGAITATCLAGCATIVQGTSQKIAVTTSPPDSNCSMSRNGQNISSLSQTPGEVTVDKTKDDILLTCAASGYEPTSQYLHSGIAIGTFGNMIIGGLVGWGIDSMTGADNEYPSSVSLSMSPVAVSERVTLAPLPSCANWQLDMKQWAREQGYDYVANCN